MLATASVAAVSIKGKERDEKMSNFLRDGKWKMMIRLHFKCQVTGDLTATSF